MVVRDPDAHPAMVNYESLVAQANKELEQQGHEPLLVVYPADGIAVSDSPFGYVDRGQGKDNAFSSFQKALVTTSALELYQTKLRKLSLTIWVVDYSHSIIKSSAVPCTSSRVHLRL